MNKKIITILCIIIITLCAAFFFLSTSQRSLVGSYLYDHQFHKDCGCSDRLLLNNDGTANQTYSFHGHLHKGKGTWHYEDGCVVLKGVFYEPDWELRNGIIVTHKNYSCALHIRGNSLTGIRLGFHPDLWDEYKKTE